MRNQILKIHKTPRKVLKITFISILSLDTKIRVFIYEEDLWTMHHYFVVAKTPSGFPQLFEKKIPDPFSTNFQEKIPDLRVFFPILIDRPPRSASSEISKNQLKKKPDMCLPVYVYLMCLSALSISLCLPESICACMCLSVALSVAVLLKSELRNVWMVMSDDVSSCLCV